MLLYSSYRRGGCEKMWNYLAGSKSTSNLICICDIVVVMQTFWQIKAKPCTMALCLQQIYMVSCLIMHTPWQHGASQEVLDSNKYASFVDKCLCVDTFPNSCQVLMTLLYCVPRNIMYTLLFETSNANGIYKKSLVLLCPLILNVNGFRYKFNQT